MQCIWSACHQNSKSSFFHSLLFLRHFESEELFWHYCKCLQLWKKKGACARFLRPGNLETCERQSKKGSPVKSPKLATLHQFSLPRPITPKSAEWFIAPWRDCYRPVISQLLWGKIKKKQLGFLRLCFWAIRAHGLDFMLAIAVVKMSIGLHL